MLESGSSGSVRGVPSNGHPYRDPGSRGVARHLLAGLPAGLACSDYALSVVSDNGV